MARRDKNAVRGEEVYNQLVASVEGSEALKALDEGQRQTLLNTLRKIAFMQVGAVYGSDASENNNIRGNEKRIDRPDYETLAQEFLAKKLESEGHSPADFLTGRSDLTDYSNITHHHVVNWFEEFITRMGTLQPHTFNQTPHPTITTTAAAFEKESDLVQFLQSGDGMRNLLKSGQRSNEDDKIAKLQQRIEALAFTLTAPAEAFTIEEEMRMSLRQSYHIYRSIPEQALSFLRVAEKTFGLEMDTKLADRKTLRDLMIEAGSKAVLNETWSPGDSDSKPNMRPEQMVKGIRMGRLAIRKQYIEDLAKIATQLGENEDDLAAKEEIKAVIWKLYNDIEELYLPSVEIADSKIEWFLTHIAPEMDEEEIENKIKQVAENSYEIKTLLAHSAAQKLSAAAIAGIADGFPPEMLAKGNPNIVAAIKATDRSLNADEITAIKTEFGEAAAAHIFAQREKVRENLPAQKFLMELRDIHKNPEVRRSRTTLRHLYKASNSITSQKNLGDRLPKTAFSDITGTYTINNQLFKQDYATEYGAFLNSPLLNDFGSGYSTNITTKKQFTNDPKQLQEDIAVLAKLPALQKVAYKDIAGNISNLAAIDALQMQANSYGLQAQRITHRQSGEAYATAMGELHHFITTEADLKEVAEAINQQFPSYSENTAKLTGELLPKLADMENKYAQLHAENSPGLETFTRELEAYRKQVADARAELTKSLIRFLNDGNNKEAADNLRYAIQFKTRAEMENVRSWQSRIDAPGSHFTLDAEQKKLVFTYESLEMVRLGMYSDGAISRQLIAEANHPECLWNVMAMQELMTNPDNKPQLSHIPKIVPLVEYPDDLENYPQMLAEAYGFEPFRESQRKLTNDQDHFFLKTYDEQTGTTRKMQVLDLLEDLRMQERKGDVCALEVIQAMVQRYDVKDPELLETLNTAVAQLQEWDADYDPQKRADLYNETLTLIRQNATLNEKLSEDVFYIEGMTAGSDATKSGSSAVNTKIKDTIVKLRVEAAAAAGYFVQQYGNGSAAHRNMITNAIIRTRQGLEMAQGPEMLSSETERIRSLTVARRMGLDVSVNKSNDLAQVAIVNLANAAGLKDTTKDVDYNELRGRDEARLKAYEELYDSPQFSHFVGACTPHKLLNVFKYAARPPGRTRDKGFNVTGMRAIGFGLANGATLGQPHLNFGMADYVFKADQATGMMDEVTLKKNTDLFLKSPDLQNEVNRAIFDLTQYQPEYGWKNTLTGCGIFDQDVERNVAKDGGITIALAGTAYRLQDLVEMNMNTAEKLGEQLGKEGISNIQMAAKLDWDMTKSLRSANQLVATLAKADQPDIASASSSKTLIENLKKLSPQLGDECDLIRKDQRNNLEAISEIFARTTKDPKTMPAHPGNNLPATEEDKAAFARYHADFQPFKRHTDNTENVPAAYYEPGHAVALSIQANKAPARRAA